MFLVYGTSSKGGLQWDPITDIGPRSLRSAAVLSWIGVWTIPRATWRCTDLPAVSSKWGALPNSILEHWESPRDNKNIQSIQWCEENSFEEWLWSEQCMKNGQLLQPVPLCGRSRQVVNGCLFALADDGNVRVWLATDAILEGGRKAKGFQGSCSLIPPRFIALGSTGAVGIGCVNKTWWTCWIRVRSGMCVPSIGSNVFSPKWKTLLLL